MIIKRRNLTKARTEASKMLRLAQPEQARAGLDLLQRHSLISADERRAFEKLATTGSSPGLAQVLQSDVAKLLATIIRIETEAGSSEADQQAMSGAVLGGAAAAIIVGAAALIDGPLPIADALGFVVVGALLGAAYDAADSISEENGNGQEGENGAGEENGTEE